MLLSEHQFTLNIHIPSVINLVTMDKIFFIGTRREFGNSLPPFPPKKLFTLTDQEVEERRQQIEKYLQLVSQVRF